MIWGYAGPWFGELTGGDDSMMAKLKWLVANGLRTTHALLPVIAPIAAACQEFGTPLGIENHGDYYCTDLVERPPESGKLVMMVEMIPPRPMEIGECFEKTMAFIRSLPEVE